jgi:hypothetical protein
MTENPLGPEDEPGLTRGDRDTLDGAQQAALPPESNAEPEFQAMPPPGGHARKSDSDEDDFDEGGEA